MEAALTFDLTLQASIQARAVASAASTFDFSLSSAVTGRSLSAAALTFDFATSGTITSRTELEAGVTFDLALAASGKARAFITSSCLFDFKLGAYLLDSTDWEGDELTWDNTSAIDLGRYPVALQDRLFIQFSPSHADFGGTPVQCFVEKLSIPAKDHTGVYLVTDVQPVIYGEIGTVLQIYLGSQELTPQDEVDWEGPYNFTIGEDDAADLIKSGRYMSVRFEATGQPHWRMPRFSLSIKRGAED